VEDGKQAPFLGSDTDSCRNPYPFFNLAFNFHKIGVKLTESQGFVQLNFEKCNHFESAKSAQMEKQLKVTEQAFTYTAKRSVCPS